MFTNFGRDIVFFADLWYNGTNEKPPSEREVARRSRDGRSLRDFGVRLTLWERTLPQSPSVTAPSRREPWDVRNHRGMGFARCICITKAKLAIKENEK